MTWPPRATGAGQRVVDDPRRASVNLVLGPGVQEQGALGGRGGEEGGWEGTRTAVEEGGPSRGEWGVTEE